MRPCGSERENTDCAPSLSLSISPSLLLLSGYILAQQLEYQLPGPDQSPRAVRAGEETADRRDADEGEKSKRVTHPTISPSAVRPSRLPPRQTDTRAAPSLLRPSPHPPGPSDCSCRASAGGARQDARWDRRADTRSSVVASRRPPRCKCVSNKCVCCLSGVRLGASSYFFT